MYTCIYEITLCLLWLLSHSSNSSNHQGEYICLTSHCTIHNNTSLTKRWKSKKYFDRKGFLPAFGIHRKRIIKYYSSCYANFTNAFAIAFKKRAKIFEHKKSTIDRMNWMGIDIEGDCMSAESIRNGKFWSAGHNQTVSI